MLTSSLRLSCLQIVIGFLFSWDSCMSILLLSCILSILVVICLGGKSPLHTTLLSCRMFSHTCSKIGLLECNPRTLECAITSLFIDLNRYIIALICLECIPYSQQLGFSCFLCPFSNCKFYYY